MKLGDLETNQTYETIRVPRQVVLEQIDPLKQRTNSIVKALSDSLGKDLWSCRLE